MPYQGCLISILVPSRRLWQLDGLIASLIDNTADISRIELLIKCDDDQELHYRDLVSRVCQRTALSIRVISTPRLFGPITMWINMQLLWRAVSPESYFVMALTDEGRFIVRDWDVEIAKYVHYYPDDVFRLRLSISRDVNYYHINQTIFQPDCFPIHTRRWLEITQGFGDCWGGDAFQESVAYHLGRGTGSYYFCLPRNSHFRDLVINTRLLGGIDEFAKDIAPEEQQARNSLMYAEWKRLVSRPGQLRHCYLARRLLLAIHASKLELSDYTIRRSRFRKRVALHDSTGTKVLAVSFDVPYWFTAWAVAQFVMLELAAFLSRIRHKVLASPYSWTVRLLLRSAIVKRCRERVAYVQRLSEAARSSKARGRGSVQPSLYGLEGPLGVHRGNLFKLVHGKLTPTRFMLRRIKKAKFVSCSADELTYWAERAYAECPAAGSGAYARAAA